MPVDVPHSSAFNEASLAQYISSSNGDGPCFANFDAVFVDRTDTARVFVAALVYKRAERALMLSRGLA